jgi:hypothetical protein
MKPNRLYALYAKNGGCLILRNFPAKEIPVNPFFRDAHFTNTGRQA